MKSKSAANGIGIVGVMVALCSMVVTVIVPEIRSYFGLDPITSKPSEARQVDGSQELIRRADSQTLPQGDAPSLRPEPATVFALLKLDLELSHSLPPLRPEPTILAQPLRRTDILADVDRGLVVGKVIRKVDPTYPRGAIEAGSSGSVNVEITVDEQGSVVSAHVLSGHPLLQDAALRAVRQWKFSQTRFEGEPVKVIGTVSFDFSL